MNERHLGQMKAAFPLSYSQRKSLYTWLSRPGEPVMAVNGPPGTGKTTLLQSIVANKLVESVLTGQPGVILACSANNQAVTNIIDSFTKKDDNELEIRWLPDVTGYAVYLPSASKPAEALRHINYMKPDGEGLFARLETPDYLQRARKEYLRQGSVRFGETFSAVSSLVERLRIRVASTGRKLEEARMLWTQYQGVQDEILREYRPRMAAAGSYETKEGMLSPKLLEQDIVMLEELTEKTLAYFRHEPVLRKLGCWLRIGAAMENRRAELNVVFRRSPVRPELLPERIPGPAVVLNGIDRLIALARRCLESIRQWQGWQEGMEQAWPDCLKKDPAFFRHSPADEATAFYDALDTTLRYQAFVDAVHYWEGRWIEETDAFLARTPAEQRKRGEDATKARWRRRAMLTPCFVSTFYMAPRFFSYARYAGKDGSGQSVFDSSPTTGFIDCLIVDEAGQVPPEVGAAVFALAAQAMVVGDVKQIEPVWNILPKVDLGNLKREGLLDADEKTAEEVYMPKGFLSSSGSIMQMAQNACGFTEPQGAERGAMLVEHRRCYNEIIGYCNELAYHGLLRPLRGPAKADALYPPMSCVHVDGKSVVQNKDRYNEAECRAICRWLADRKEAIEKRYVDGKDYRCLEDIVGILTPFVGQKKRLRQTLRQAGFDADRFKLGTVHALQGAERPIVLFSAVYGPGEVGTLFFDAGNKPNMLNVAVSRAKDCFIVFANTRIFDPQADTPSGVLARHLGCKNHG